MAIAGTALLLVASARASAAVPEHPVGDVDPHVRAGIESSVRLSLGELPTPVRPATKPAHAPSRVSIQPGITGASLRRSLGTYASLGLPVPQGPLVTPATLGLLTQGALGVPGLAPLGASPTGARAPSLVPLLAISEEAAAAALLPGRRNYLIPALETVAFNFGLLAINNFVLQQEFARVRWSDIVQHIDGRRGWTFDIDVFVINQLGHPYQGALAHSAARSSGLSFWEGALYATASSLLWEMALERDPPSINDQITTTLGGVFLGEALHRSFRFLIDDSEGRNSFLNRAVATLVSPASALNHWLLNDEMDRRDFSTRAVHLGVFEVGTTLSTRIRDTVGDEQTGFFRQGPQLFLGTDLTYGVPVDDGRDYSVPFSHYAVSVDLAVPRIPLANLFIRGLLTGTDYGNRESRFHGLFGLFGLYDLSANHDVRVSSVGAGLGTTFRARFGDRNLLNVTAIGGIIGMGAAGSVGLAPVPERDYLFGPGFNGILEASVLRSGLGSLALRSRTWKIEGVYTAPRGGSEWITYSSFELRARVAHRLAVGFDLPLMTRVFRLATSVETERAQIGANPRLVVTFSSLDAFVNASP